MPEEKLNIDERYKLLRITSSRYREAPGPEKSRILDSLVLQTGLDRKTVIRRLNGACVRKKRQRQRGRKYGPDVDDALRVISESYNYVCAERLQPNLVWFADRLEQSGELQLTPSLNEQLGQISISTVRRILKRIHQDLPRRRRVSGFSPNARSRIPILRIPWDEREPGHFETDLVHHCGPIASGEYLYSLVMVDVATGWCECAALLGRSYRGMSDGFTRCLLRCPISVLEVHTDNGSEFFSSHVLQFWQERAKVPQLSRSRPYRKNDNRFVEHRNGALVRAWLGHDRMDTTQQTIALNDFYDRLWLYFNFFQPVMRLAGKTWDGQRVVRVHDSAQTPFDRLVAAEVLDSSQLDELRELRNRCNPRQLRKELLDDVSALFSMPLATEGVSEDIFSTLLNEPVERG